MIDTPDRFLNRELSILDFQERVLALAASEDIPLLERVKFLAIVSSNIDEFFQVRVAGLVNQVEAGVASTSPDGRSPRQQLADIEVKVSALNEAADRIFTDHLLPSLEKEDIRFVDWADLGPADRSELSDTFEQQIFPVLTPLAVDPSHPFPYISNLSLNLAVLLRSPDREGIQFARVKVPPILPRFVMMPDGERFVPLEQIIASHLGRLFGGQQVVEDYFFRVTRSADYAVEEEEAEDLLEAMESVLQFRQRQASAVRLEVDAHMTDEARSVLTKALRVDDSLVYERTAPLGLAGLSALYDLDRPDLKDTPWVPATQSRLSDVHKDVDFFAEIAQSDILVHHPYESFATSTEAFVAQAAADPNVLAIKQTLYRTSVPEDPAIGGERAIVESLMLAAEAGKQVVVLVELKARFDEASNIAWAKMLESAGAHVVYGVAGLKTHSKILLVVRREDGHLERYAHIGTGNYNPKTARIYEDLGLFTADPDIGADLSEVFNLLTGYAGSNQYRKLLVAPATLRDRITERIREEGSKGRDGFIMLKINHLLDSAIIDELYAASQQGCRIDLIVRGVCSLRPGVPGISETITVRSLVGRFLEHSRIYRFGHPEANAVYYIGSADLMPRNLNVRVETLVPVTDERLKARLEEVLQVEMADDDLAWSLGPEGEWSKVGDEAGVNAQTRFMELAAVRSRAEAGVP